MLRRAAIRKENFKLTVAIAAVFEPVCLERVGASA
jgi:hypothetical protein